MADRRQDMKAIELLLKELSKVKSIPKPPTDYAQAGKYKKSTEKVISECTSKMTDVRAYSVRINTTIDQVRAALKDQTTNIQKSIKKALESIPSTFGNESVGKGNKSSQPSQPSHVLHYVKELQQVAKSATKLEEFMLNTEEMLAMVQKNVDVTMDDIDILKGYLKSWKLEKDEIFEEEKRQLGEKRRKQAEGKKRRREKDEKKAKRGGRTQTERIIRRRDENREDEEKEEKERKPREDKERSLEEERLKKEEEERLKKEQEERMKQEEEKRRRQEEEDRRRKREEEEAKLRELERHLEAERLAKERRDKDEAARRWRLDPNNWHNTVYSRNGDEVDGDRSYHKNVCCVLSYPPSGNESDEDAPDLECLASDEVDEIIETLSDGEKLASSIVSINSKKGELALEAPMRAFLPHRQPSDPGEELIMKVSVNGSEWDTSTPYLPTRQIEAECNTKLLGAEIDKFESIKLVIVARRKTQTIIVDKPGITQLSNYDKNIKIFVPRDTVKSPTELKMSVKPITEEMMGNLSKDNPLFDGVLSVSSLMTLSCQRPFAKDIELDLLKSGQKSSKVRVYHLYRTPDQGWKFADTAYKGRNDDVTVILPTMKSKYCLMQLDLLPSVPKENALKIAEKIYDQTNKTAVKFILRQNVEKPTKAVLHCVKHDLELSRLAELKDDGFTLGTDVSKEFYLSEGQTISVSCSGNIDNLDGKSSFPFFVYMDTAKEELTFHVKDTYKQKDLPQYIGNLVCTIDDPSQQGRGNSHGLRIELPIKLPKTERIRLRKKAVPIRLPYYLSSMAYFLACKLTERGEGLWYTVIERMGGKNSTQALYRRAKTKVVDDTDEIAVCRSLLLDWMKTTERQRDKLCPIEKALEYFGLSNLRHECHNFVDHLKEHLSDTVMANLAKQLSGDPKQIGLTLGLDERLVTKIVQDFSVNDQMEALLQEWRHSEAAVQSGINADQYLRDLLKM